MVALKWFDTLGGKKTLKSSHSCDTGRGLCVCNCFSSFYNVERNLFSVCGDL